MCKTITFENGFHCINHLIKHTYAEDYSTWRRQSEFERPTINTEIVTGRGSAAIMLVLDCSSSLGYDFVKLKSAGKEFINTVFNASNGTTPPGNTSESKSVETFTVNGVSFDMVRVDGGTYQMGANYWGWSQPIHSETVNTFYIGRTEVTQALWQAVMGSNPSGYSSNNRPVENVSWDDCQQFITKLNQLTGRNFRLPGEAEWEYAARGGNKSRGYTYSGSNDIGSVAWYDGNSGDQTHPVAQKQANELGLYDMTGNVWEWTADKWCDDYSSPRNSSYRVYRGGCWCSPATYCRVAGRNGISPGSRNIDLGLRLAL